MKLDALQLNLSTPWQEVHTNWSEAGGISLFIKRDDQIHPIISGNKWRKLSGILQQYAQFDRLVTYGGAYSNHLVATAKTAQILGVPCTGIVRGEAPKRRSTVLELCTSYGMELEFISRDNYARNKRRKGVENNILYIPEGGSCYEGSLGCQEIIAEASPDLDLYVIACGTGTSLAGMAAALDQKGSSARLVGVPVLKQGDFINGEIKALNGKTNFELWTDFHFGGYARTTPELFEFIEGFCESTGVLLEPIYTAKACFAIQKKLADGQIPAGSRVGLVHTGGLTGWYGKWTEVYNKKKTRQ